MLSKFHILNWAKARVISVFFDNDFEFQTLAIAYADDDQGTNFSLTPTQTSHFISLIVSAKTPAELTSVDFENKWVRFKDDIQTIANRLQVDEDGKLLLDENGNILVQ